MQHELDALMRAIQGDGAKRARMTGILQEIAYAMQMHAARTAEADRELIARLQKAIDDAAPEPRVMQSYEQWAGVRGHG